MNLDEYVVLRMPRRFKKAVASYGEDLEMTGARASATFRGDRSAATDFAETATGDEKDWA